METSVSVSLYRPARCSKVDLDAFERLVKIGGEVMDFGLRERIKNSYLLALAKTASREAIGVAALKSPNADYRNTIFKKSHSREKPSDWRAELGWIFVVDQYRNQGLARSLVKALFGRDVGISVYATAREKNDPILPLLRRFGFVQTGQAYASREGDYNLILYVRSA